MGESLYERLMRQYNAAPDVIREHLTPPNKWFDHPMWDVLDPQFKPNGDLHISCNIGKFVLKRKFLESSAEVVNPLILSISLACQKNKNEFINKCIILPKSD